MAELAIEQSLLDLTLREAARHAQMVTAQGQQVRQLMTRLLESHGYRLIPYTSLDWPTRDAEFQEIFRYQAAFGWRNIRSKKAQRMYMVRNLLLSSRYVDGEWAECGVYNGSTALLMAEYARRYDLLPSGRRIHLFDSFEGLSEPTEFDDGTSMTAGDFRVSLDDVRRNLKEYDIFEFHRGWIPDGFVEVSNKRFAFVHIDVDLYNPILASLTFFIPRMVNGGIVVMDDYGGSETPGATKAADHAAHAYGVEIARLPFGQAFILVRCPQ